MFQLSRHLPVSSIRVDSLYITSFTFMLIRCLGGTMLMCFLLLLCSVYICYHIIISCVSVEISKKYLFVRLWFWEQTELVFCWRGVLFLVSNQIKSNQIKGQTFLRIWFLRVSYSTFLFWQHRFLSLGFFPGRLDPFYKYVLVKQVGLHVLHEAFDSRF